MSFTSGINHVVVISPDLDRMVRFYRDAFAANTVFESQNSVDYPRMAIVDLGNGRYVKILEAKPEASGPVALLAHETTVRIERFGLAVDSIDQLLALRAHMQAQGITVGKIEKIPTQWVLSVQDPDRAILQVSAHVR